MASRDSLASLFGFVMEPRCPSVFLMDVFWSRPPSRSSGSLEVKLWLDFMKLLWQRIHWRQSIGRKLLDDLAGEWAQLCFHILHQTLFSRWFTFVSLFLSLSVHTQAPFCFDNIQFPPSHVIRFVLQPLEHFCTPATKEAYPPTFAGDQVNSELKEIALSATMWFGSRLRRTHFFQLLSWFYWWISFHKSRFLILSFPQSFGP